jgi:hypothetical protein
MAKVPKLLLETMTAFGRQARLTLDVYSFNLYKGRNRYKVLTNVTILPSKRFAVLTPNQRADNVRYIPG